VHARCYFATFPAARPSNCGTEGPSPWNGGLVGGIEGHRVGQVLGGGWPGRPARSAIRHPHPPGDGTVDGTVTLADDAYHLADHQGASHMFWYTEWWYFNSGRPEDPQRRAW